MVWASILGPKIDENRRRKARKASKLWKQFAFGRYRFFIVFWIHFSMNFGSPGDVQNRLFHYFFRLFCSPVASELLLGSPGTVSGQYFIDFRLILARFWLDFFAFFCQFAVVLLPLLDRFWIVFFARARFSIFFWPPLRKKNSD